MLAFALGLGSSLCWGLADFFGGLQSRRHPVVAVMLVSQAAGLVAIAVLVAALGQGAPGPNQMLPAALAGAAGAIALTAFYRALAIGTMSIVAPISATGAALPVVVGVAGGERPGTLQLAGMAAAVIGVVLASREEDEEGRTPEKARLSVALALFAALGFGTFFVAMDAAADADVGWAMLVARCASVGLVMLAVAVLRPRMGVGVTALAPLVAVGMLDAAANGLYAWGSTEGLLSVVAVLGALYPVTTVLLARGLLRERVRRIQEVGIVAALAGVALIAVG